MVVFICSYTHNPSSDTPQSDMESQTTHLPSTESHVSFMQSTPTPLLDDLFVLLSSCLSLELRKEERMNTGFNSRPKSNEKGEAGGVRGGEQPGGGVVHNTNVSATLSLLIFPQGAHVFFIYTEIRWWCFFFSLQNVQSNMDTCSPYKSGGHFFPWSIDRF